MFTEEEFQALLEEAFEAGYNTALDEIFDEDSSYDLEEEMSAYNENLTDSQKKRIRGVMGYGDNRKDFKSPKERSDRLRALVAMDARDTNREMYKAFKDAKQDGYKDDADEYDKLMDQKSRAAKRMNSVFNRYYDKVSAYDKRDRMNAVKKSIKDKILHKN